MAETLSHLQQQYLNESNAAINSQIQLQLYATYIYLSMAAFCNQDEVALRYFALFFLRQSQKWMSRTEMLFGLLTQRRGSLMLGRIADQDRQDWMDGLMAMECAFHLEKTLNQSLLQLHQLANSNGDISLCSFLKHHFVPQQVKIIKEMGGYLTNLRNMGAPKNRMAEYLFDKLTMADIIKES
ncbi:ferritin heavy polypeptide-like 17 [Acomys russatus]|uniref:ferritin heavy polypeptide-like 17 n=1 Tax=Acomys russatus TaxID=60746 RepID=UPI0021E33205|nr:ferritin heavy polypeptide-like 17 [Acomys russatus]